MRKTMTEKIICLIVASLFFVNDICFGLGVQPGSTQPATKDAMYALAGKELAAARGSSNVDFTHIMLGEEPRIKGVKLIKTNWKNPPKEWKKWKSSPIFTMESFTEAFSYWMVHEAGISADFLEIRRGRVEVEEGVLPISSTTEATATGKTKYILTVDDRFEKVWPDIRKNDIWFIYTFPDGKKRVISVAYAIFNWLAKHEMTDIAQATGLPKDGALGHIVAIPGIEPRIIPDEVVTNFVGGQYTLPTEAAKLFFLGAYCCDDSTRYDNDKFLKQINGFFNKKIQNKPHKGREPLKIYEEFPLLLNDPTARSEAFRLACFINYHYFSRPGIQAVEIDTEKETSTHASMKTAVGKRFAANEGPGAEKAADKVGDLLGQLNGLIERYEKAPSIPHGSTKLVRQENEVREILAKYNSDVIGRVRAKLSDELRSARVVSSIRDIPAEDEHILLLKRFCDLLGGYPEKNQSVSRAKSGKSPEDLLKLIVLYTKIGEELSAPKLLDLYAQRWKRLGFEESANDRKSALRTIERDLFEADNSLERQGIVKRLGKKGENGAFLFEMTTKGCDHAVTIGILSPEGAATGKQFAANEGPGAQKSGETRSSDALSNIGVNKTELGQQAIQALEGILNKEGLDGMVYYVAAITLANMVVNEPELGQQVVQALKGILNKKGLDRRVYKSAADALSNIAKKKPEFMQLSTIRSLEGILSREGLDWHVYKSAADVLSKTQDGDGAALRELDARNQEALKDHELVKVIDKFVIDVGHGEGPGIVKLDTDELRDMYEAIGLTKKMRIEIIQPQSFGSPSDKIHRAILEINNRNRMAMRQRGEKEEDTIVIRRYSDDENLKNIVENKAPEGVIRMVVTNKEFSEDQSGTKEEKIGAYLKLFGNDLSIFNNTRVLNIKAPEGYEKMTGDRKAFHEFRLYMIAVLGSVVNNKNNIGRAALAAMLEGYVDEDPKTFIENFAKDENSWDGGHQARITYFLGKTVSLLEKLIKELDYLKLRMKTLWIAA